MPHTRTIIEILKSHHLAALTAIQSKPTMLRRWWLSFNLTAPLACCELQENTDWHMGSSALFPGLLEGRWS